MRKRTLALLIAGTFLFGTAAACSDDEGTTTDENATTTTAGEGGDEGSDDGASSDDPVQAYCDAVDAAIEGGAPSAEDLADLQAQATELGSALATDYTPEELEQATADLQDCITRLATGG